jgi:hypothetical protein
VSNISTLGGGFGMKKFLEEEDPFMLHSARASDNNEPHLATRRYGDTMKSAPQQCGMSQSSHVEFAHFPVDSTRHYEVFKIYFLMFKST